MNLRLSPDLLRTLRRPEAVLVVLILVVAAGWLYLDRQTKDAELEVSGLDRKSRAARDDLRVLEDNSNLAALQKELEQLRSAPRPVTLPSREDALKFLNEMPTYASEKGLPLSTFEFANASAGVAGTDYPIVRYSVVARGTLEPLVGALKLLQDFPTATVQALRLTRFAAGGEGQWEMKFDLDVLYRKEGT
jgi:hypothetical protein